MVLLVYGLLTTRTEFVNLVAYCGYRQPDSGPYASGKLRSECLDMPLPGGWNNFLRQKAIVLEEPHEALGLRQ